MSIRDLIGIVFCIAGVTIGTMGYRLLGLQWYFGACALLVVGMLLIWSSARDRKIRDGLDDVPGDWGDRHYLSGSSSTDGYDGGGDVGDAS
jgi:hypothetical protein